MNLMIQTMPINWNMVFLLMNFINIMMIVKYKKKMMYKKLKMKKM